MQERVEEKQSGEIVVKPRFRLRKDMIVNLNGTRYRVTKTLSGGRVHLKELER